MGQELVFLGPTELMVARVETEPTFSPATPEPLFSANEFLGTTGREYEIAPDGERFLLLISPDEQLTGGLVFVLNWFGELKARVPVP